MKTKVWLTRSWCGYELWASKPFKFCRFNLFKGGAYRGGKILKGVLCPRITKNLTGLKKHLNLGSKQILEGTMEFKFKEK